MKKEHLIKSILLKAQDNGWEEIPTNIPFEIRWIQGRLALNISGQLMTIPMSEVILNKKMLSFIMPEEEAKEFAFTYRLSWRQAAETLIKKFSTNGSFSHQNIHHGREVREGGS